MTIKRNLIIIALVLPTSAVLAQLLSPQQLAYLRQQFIQEVAESVDGTALKIGTLPLDRLDEVPVPASSIQEADPIAVPLAAANASAIASLNSSLGTTDSDVSAAEANITSLQSSVVTLQSDVTALEAEPVLAPVGITTNIVLSVSATQTNTFNFVSGVLTGHTQVGP